MNAEKTDLRYHSLKNKLLLFVIASLPALFLFSRIPPTWNFTDSFDYLIIPKSDLNLLHFPPFYKFFLDFLKSLSPSLSSYLDTVPMETTVYLIAITQQVLFSASLVYFADAVGKNLLGKMGALAALLVMSSFFLFNHGVFSEGIWISLLLIQMTSAFKIYHEEGSLFVNILVYVIASILQILTRHIGIIFLGFIPLVYLTDLLLAPRKSSQPSPWLLGRSRKACFYKLIGSIFLACLIVAETKIIHKTILSSHAIEPRSMIAHVAAYRIQHIPWDSLNDRRKTDMMDKILKRASNSTVEEAISVVIDHRMELWAGTWHQIYKIVLKNSPFIKDEQKLRAQTDNVFNEICWLFYTAGFPELWIQVPKDIGRYLMTTTTEVNNHILDQSARALMIINFLPDLQQKFFGVKSVEKSEAETFTRFKDSPYVPIAGNISSLSLSLFVLLLILLFYRQGRLDKKSALFSGAVLLFSFLSLIPLATITEYVARYAVSGFLLQHFALGIVLGRLGRRKPFLTGEKMESNETPSFS